MPKEASINTQINDVMRINVDSVHEVKLNRLKIVVISSSNVYHGIQYQREIYDVGGSPVSEYVQSDIAHCVLETRS